jgi:membrane-anchored glycerophosphoryl diester phosphodiesterase (GDPDase)
MKKFFKELFSDDNQINEKSFIGFLAFLMMVFTLGADVVTGILGKEMPIQEFIFDGFMVIVLGAFGIASVDKFINARKNKNEENAE